MIPPSRCWIMMFWPAAATYPAAMVAPASGAVDAHNPKVPSEASMNK